MVRARPPERYPPSKRNSRKIEFKSSNQYVHDEAKIEEDKHNKQN